MRRIAAALAVVAVGSFVAVAPSHHANGPVAVTASTITATSSTSDRLELLELKKHHSLNVRSQVPARRAPARASRARRARVVSTPVCTISSIRSTVSSGEAFIIERESGWSVTDYNPINTTTGHAFGLGQLTDENRERYARHLGVDSYTRDACAQLAMMRMYIKERYGSTDAAVAHWHNHRWY